MPMIPSTNDAAPGAVKVRALVASRPRMRMSCATTQGAYAIAVTSTYSSASRRYSWKAASTISVTERARRRRSDITNGDGGLRSLPRRRKMQQSVPPGQQSRLLHRHRLREIARLVDVEPTLHRHVVREQLQRDHRQNRIEHVLCLRNPNLVIDELLENGLLLARDRDDLTAPRLHLLNVRHDLVEHRVVRCDEHYRHVLVDERDRPVLHLRGRIAFGVDVADLLQLQRPLERDREIVAATEVEEIGRVLELLRDRLDLARAIQDRLDLVRQLEHRLRDLPPLHHRHLAQTRELQC